MKYIELIEVIRNKNVELRHDIDVSLDSAFNMAKYEKNLGIKSTYYFRFDCDYYNVLSIKNKNIIDFLIKNHDVGCHVDCTNIENDGDLLMYLNTYKDIIPFYKFTFHINTEKTKNFGDIKGYENKSLINGPYVSDSKCSFDDEKLDFMKENDYYTLVVHPEWWDNEEFSFTNNCLNTIIDKLNFDIIKNKVTKEILNYE